MKAQAGRTGGPKQSRYVDHPGERTRGQQYEKATASKRAQAKAGKPGAKTEGPKKTAPRKTAAKKK